MKNYSDHTNDNVCNSEFEICRRQAKDELIARFHRKGEKLNLLEKTIVNESDRDVLAYIAGSLNLKRNARSIILTTTSYSYLDNVDFDNVRAIINLEPTVSQTGKSRQLLQAVNKLLPDAGIYIGLSHEMLNSMATHEEFVNNGFSIVDISPVHDTLYFTAIKTGEPATC